MKYKEEEFETFEVDLDKNNDEELGLNIYEKYAGSGVYVGNVFKGTAASREGSLKSGDHIVKINGVDVDESTSEEVAKHLKKSKGSIRIIVGRSKNPKAESESSSYIASLLSNIERESMKLEHTHSHQRPSFEPDKGPNDHFVEIAKNPLQSLGINIAGGVASPLGNIPIIVASVEDGGPAEGKLQVGDKILSINGQSTERKTHEEVVWMIKGSTDAIILMKVRRGDKDVEMLVRYLTETAQSVSKYSVSSLDEEYEEISKVSEAKPVFQKAEEVRVQTTAPPPVRSGPMQVGLDQTKDGLGFSVVGGYGSMHGDLPFFIKSIFDSGAASQDGSLRRGDMIVSVNGKTLDGCTHAEGVAILKNAKGRVILNVVPTGS